VALAGHKLDLCRQRIQQDTLGHRGRSGDPLYGVRRALRTRDGVLNRTPMDPDRRSVRRRCPRRGRDDLVRLPAAHRRLRSQGPATRERPCLLATLIDLLRSGLPAGLEELATLGRTLHRRRDDVLAYFTHRASNGPTEAINGRLEALRRNALGFRNLINYRIRSLLHCGNLAL
jgi:transposase